MYPLGLFMCVVGVCITVTNIFICIQTFSKYCAIKKYGILRPNHIAAILQNKRERKYKTGKFLLNIVFKGYQIATDEMSSKKTYSTTNIQMTFLVAALVWMPTLI